MSIDYSKWDNLDIDSDDGDGPAQAQASSGLLEQAPLSAGDVPTLQAIETIHDQLQERRRRQLIAQAEVGGDGAQESASPSSVGTEDGLRRVVVQMLIMLQAQGNATPSAKEIHALVQRERDWKDTPLSDVRRALSKQKKKFTNAVREVQATAAPALPTPEDASTVEPYESLDCCAWCGSAFRTGATGLRGKCARCRLVRYCCQEHQKAAWKAGHKASCGQPLPSMESILRLIVVDHKPEKVVALLREFGVGHSEIAVTCLNGLCKLELDRDRASCVRALEQYGTLPVVAAMRAHAGEPDLLCHACELVCLTLRWAYNMDAATADDLSDKFADGALSIVLHAMKTHPRDMASRGPALWYVLCFRHCDPRADKRAHYILLENAGMELLVAAFRQWPDTYDIIRSICEAALQLCVCEAAFDLALEAGLIELVLQAMRRHANNPGVVEIALELIGGFAGMLTAWPPAGIDDDALGNKKVSIHRKLIELGAASLVSSAIENHPARPKIQRLGPSISLTMAALSAGDMACLHAGASPEQWNPLAPAEQWHPLLRGAGR